MAPHVEEPQHDCPGIDGVATPVGGGQLPRGHGLGLGLAGGALPPPALGGSKRGRTRSGNDLTRLGSTSAAASSALSDPLVPPASGAPPPGEPMARYFGRVKGAALGLGGVGFGVVTQEPSAGGFVPAADGLYIHKRPIRGLGSGNPLAVGGSIFYHTLVYLKTGGKLMGLEFGPASMQDVTENFMEEAEARPVLMSEGGPVSIPAEDTAPLLHIKAPLRSLADKVVQEAIAFCNSKKYHVVHNNCIQTCDFLVRVLTAGAVRSAPFIYDALCGNVPPADPPMLLLLPLMMQKTWHQVCDGGHLMAEFLGSHSFPPILCAPSDGVEANAEPGSPPKRHETTAESTLLPQQGTRADQQHNPGGNEAQDCKEKQQGDGPRLPA